MPNNGIYLSDNYRHISPMIATRFHLLSKAILEFQANQTNKNCLKLRLNRPGDQFDPT